MLNYSGQKSRLKEALVGSLKDGAAGRSEILLSVGGSLQKLTLIVPVEVPVRGAE